MKRIGVYMPKIVKPLTDTQIRQAKPKEKEYNLSDGQGLQLRIKPTGKKVWLLNYCRPKTKKRANLAIGRYPSTSLSTARQHRDDALTLLAQGIDPSEFKAEQELSRNNQHSFYAISQQWFEVKRHSVTEDYAQDIWRSLELHLFPSIGNLNIHDLKPQIVINTLKPLANKGNLESVKRVCQRLNEVITYAVNIGIIEINVFLGIRHAFQPPKATHMPTLEPHELGKLMVDIHNASIRRVTRLLIEWQLHTMVRPSEASGTQWCEIDEEQRLWVIPAERMKKKMAHTVPLSDYAIKLLQEAKSLNDNSLFVFPADRKRGEPTNPQTANMALKRMGYQGKLVAHGLRALASTTLNEKGIDPDLIEAALAHTDKNSVRRAYNRTTYIERRREVMNIWSQHIISTYKDSL